MRLNILSLSLACSLDSRRRDRTRHTGLEGADPGAASLSADCSLPRGLAIGSPRSGALANVDTFFVTVRLMGGGRAGPPHPRRVTGQPWAARVSADIHTTQDGVQRTETRGHTATHTTLAGLTWVTIVFSGQLAAGWGVSGSPFPGRSSTPLSGPLAPALSSRAAWDRIAAMHSSTWKCKKLFQVYLKNRSWGKQRTEESPRTDFLLAAGPQRRGGRCPLTI